MVLRTVRFNHGSSGSMLFLYGAVLRVERTAMMRGSRLIGLDRTIQFGFKNHGQHALFLPESIHDVLAHHPSDRTIVMSYETSYDTTQDCHLSLRPYNLCHLTCLYTLGAWRNAVKKYAAILLTIRNTNTNSSSSLS